MNIKIYDYDGFPNPARVRIALAEKGATDKVQFVHVDVMKGEHRLPAFTSKNPSASVPATELRMNINADFNLRVVMHAAAMPWVDSPVAGVQRRMLDRIGEEAARATTVVRYAPGSKFTAHTHNGGEEFIVLEGVFQDEHGDYPAGSYIRNPPTSRHKPGSALGCIIFVKLWQFSTDDRTRVIADMNKMGKVSEPTRSGVAVTPLFEDERETVQLEHWQPCADVHLTFADGAELLVLAGDFTDNGDRLNVLSWMRLPCGGQLSAKAGSQGAKVWIKQRHLRFVEPLG